jgi:hypothetical protein
MNVKRVQEERAMVAPSGSRPYKSAYGAHLRDNFSPSRLQSDLTGFQSDLDPTSNQTQSDREANPTRPQSGLTPAFSGLNRSNPTTGDVFLKRSEDLKKDNVSPSFP